MSDEVHITKGLAALVAELQNLEEETKSLFEKRDDAMEVLSVANFCFAKKMIEINDLHMANAIKRDALIEAIAKLASEK